MSKQDQTDLLAFVITQIESQVERIRDDKAYKLLDDDAKLAIGGILGGTTLLRDLLKEIATETRKPFPGEIDKEMQSMHAKNLLEIKTQEA